MTTKRIILVTGATGREGSALIRSLLRPNQSEAQKINSDISYTIYALTRNPSGPAAQALLKTCPFSNLHIVQGNLDDRESIHRVFQTAKDDDQDAKVGIWGVYAIIPSQRVAKSADPERAQGMLLADMALDFRVDVFVFSSFLRRKPRYDDSLYVNTSSVAHASIENYAKKLGAMGFKWVIMRTAPLMESFDGYMGTVVYSVLKQGLKFDTTVEFTSCEDIGNVVAGVFHNHQRYIGKTLTVVSDRLSMPRLGTTYRDVTGTPISDVPSFVAWVIIKISTDVQVLLKSIERNHQAHMSGGYPEFEEELALARLAAPMQNYAEWLKRQKR